MNYLPICRFGSSLWMCGDNIGACMFIYRYNNIPMLIIER